MAIWFHNESSHSAINNKRLLKSWIREIIKSYRFSIGAINIILVDDEEILNVNRTFLNHNYFTDVITFDYTDRRVISGDIYISIDSVLNNANHFKQSLNDELKRVIIHGILHLLGFNDSTEEEKIAMRKLENRALNKVKDLLII